ncbi:hypothetical protein HanXRQr2_Chr02g0061081 [Helianthus annuus]|uniref:Uncharacterized protein n=1 Tax=Helianthus annuus TaxID=4232 RepID=A0A9K3NZ88_HELAN|nr:hypothetical protein HanXRQr2_Chr02g0061081 [Helianthus annuus]KAJ0951452.1 hypothetical protein HanPSC8_Chr02g0060151 [Helianthus annuus]
MVYGQHVKVIFISFSSRFDPKTSIFGRFSGEMMKMMMIRDDGDDYDVLGWPTAAPSELQQRRRQLGFDSSRGLGSSGWLVWLLYFEFGSAKVVQPSVRFGSGSVKLNTSLGDGIRFNGSGSVWSELLCSSWVRVSVQRLRVTVHASGFGSVNISQQRLGSWFGLTRSNRVNSGIPGQLSSVLVNARSTQDPECFSCMLTSSHSWDDTTESH